MLAVVPVVSLMLAGQEVWPVVPLTLHELQEVVGAVVPLLHRYLGQVHLLLGGHHLWQRNREDDDTDESQASTFWRFHANREIKSIYFNLQKKDIINLLNLSNDKSTLVTTLET